MKFSRFIGSTTTCLHKRLCIACRCLKAMQQPSYVNDPKAAPTPPEKRKPPALPKELLEYESVQLPFVRMDVVGTQEFPYRYHLTCRSTQPMWTGWARCGSWTRSGRPVSRTRCASTRRPRPRCSDWCRRRRSEKPRPSTPGLPTVGVDRTQEYRMSVDSPTCDSVKCIPLQRGE